MKAIMLVVCILTLGALSGCETTNNTNPYVNHTGFLINASIERYDGSSYIGFPAQYSQYTEYYWKLYFADGATLSFCEGEAHPDYDKCVPLIGYNVTVAYSAWGGVLHSITRNGEIPWKWER